MSEETPEKQAGRPEAAAKYERGFYVAGVGASAGGLEALEDFFASMPIDSGLAFVVVQHLSPDFKSHMRELLSRKTKIPVEGVTDGMELSPDTIHLMPPNKEIEIEDGKFRLIDRDPDAPVSHPIDRFFVSLARECADRSVGIVLSGTGSDGSRGVRKIHEAGGLVFVQDEETAKFDGMPFNARATGIADFVLPPGRIAEELCRQLNDPLVPDEAGPAEPRVGTAWERIFQALRGTYGIDFAQYKPATVRRRVYRRMRMLNRKGIDAYADTVENDPEELDSLYHDLLIGVTQFFRDREAFEWLRENVVPELVDRASESGRLRVWVAGCASGEEAYSLAILIDECIREREAAVDPKIFATDIHGGSLARASLGVYPAEAVAEVDEARLARYFTRSDGGYQVTSEIRGTIVFANHTVFRDAPFTQLDFVACRNLLIYLKPAAQSRALTMFHFGLKRDGFLFLGPSETPGSLSEEFDTVNSRWRIYKKRRDLRLPLELRVPQTTKSTKIPRAALTTDFDSSSTESRLMTYERLLAMHLPPSLLVGSDRELEHAFGGAERFLRFRSGKHTGDVLEVIDKGLEATLRNALDRATKDGKEIRYTGLSTNETADDVMVDLVVTPIRDVRSETLRFLVKMLPRGKGEETEDDSEDRDYGELPSDYVRSIESELRTTRENLQATIEELETSNEELQATNEELIASNEELQSTNEELQSVNEELHTVNTEHQQKIEELTRAHDDMDNLLAITRVGVIFLDENACIRSYTPEIARLFNLMSHDAGRKLAYFRHNFTDHPMDEDVARVLETENECEESIVDNSGRPYLLRIAPYRSAGKMQGVALTLVDMSDLTLARRDLAKFAQMSEQAADIHLLIDGDGEIQYANRSVLRETGHEVSALIGEPYTRLDADAENGVVGQWIEQASKDEDGVQVEREFRRRDGETFPVDMTLSAIRFGGEWLLYANVRDITERREAERGLALYRSAVDATGSGVTIADAAEKDTPIVFANRGFSKMTGYGGAEILGKNCRFLQGENTSDQARKKLRDAIRAGEQVRVEILNYRKDGKAFWNDVSVNPVVDARGHLTHFVGVQTDITANMEARRRATEREARIRALMNSTAEGLLGIDEQGVCTFCNAPALEMLGCDRPKELVGTVCATLFADHQSETAETGESEKVRRRVAILTGRDPAQLDGEVFRRADGTTFPVEIRVQPIADDGAQHGTVVSFVDTTERTWQEERLDRARRDADSANRAKSEFLANMSHEIRTPLTAIVAFVDLLKLDRGRKKLKDHLDSIKRNAYSLLDIVDDILDLSKIEADQIEIIEEKVVLASLMADLRSMMGPRAEARQLGLGFESDGEIPVSIVTDKGRLRQILVNLVGNAIKFTREGTVTVRVGLDENTLRVAVQDTGIGISEDAKEIVFQPFQQSDRAIERRFGGSGLGLSISRRLAERLGGHIELESELGEGSTFTLHLPIGAGASVERTTEVIQERKEPAEDTTFPKLRGSLLLVDDHEDIRDSVGTLLEKLGADVTTAARAAAGLRIIKERGEEIDLVLLDIQMPRVSGFELLREIRSAGYSQPVIALTAQAMRGDRARCLAAGFDDYLSKPVDPWRLAERVAEHLSSGSGGGVTIEGELVGTDGEAGGTGSDGNGASESSKSKKSRAKKSKSKKSKASRSGDDPVRILLVEDSEAAAKALELLLASDGHEVRSANTVKEAHEIAEGFDADLFLFDVRLPDGNGVDLMQDLRADDRFAKAAFVATTGLTDEKTLKRLRSDGFDDVMVKPLDTKALLKYVASL